MAKKKKSKKKAKKSIRKRVKRTPKKATKIDSATSGQSSEVGGTVGIDQGLGATEVENPVGRGPVTEDEDDFEEDDVEPEFGDDEQI